MKKRLRDVTLFIFLTLSTSSLLQSCVTHYGQEEGDSIQFYIYPSECEDDDLECYLGDPDTLDNEIYAQLYEKQKEKSIEEMETGCANNDICIKLSEKQRGQI